MNSNWYRVLSTLQSEFVRATTEFYSDKGLNFALLPLTTGAISSPMGLGSDSSPISVNIAGVDTYMADSMQFFLEFMCRLNNEGFYYIAPSFRGEKADERHLCQFYHSEAEIVGKLDDVILLVEEYIAYLCEQYLINCQGCIVDICGTTTHIENFLRLTSVPRCDFDTAVEILGNNSRYFCEHDVEYRSINSYGERKLIEHFGGYVWLTHFSHLTVPFYQKFVDGKALCADLLMGIGETVGAGERHYSAQDVIDALELHNISSVGYEWYIDMRAQIPLQTSGFGMGVERFMMWLCDQDDIRDMQIIPRFNGEVTSF